MRSKEKLKFNVFWVILLALLMCLIFSFSIFAPVSDVFANSEPVYTNVVEDLSKDDRFDRNDFPANDTDYSLKVIQIAESVSKELFVYVYQPSYLTATSISFSTSMDDDFSPSLYELEMISCDETLAKYVVKNFVVKNDPVRYYDIVSIYRHWIEDYDEVIPGQSISEVAYAVGNLYVAKTVDGQVYYSYLSTETIEITDKFVGFVRYESGYDFTKFFNPSGITVPGYDCHFIAFSTDHDIDRLMEVQVFYSTQSYSLSRLNGLVGDPRYGGVENHNITLNYTDKYSVDIPTNMYGSQNHYEWDRIKSAKDFVNSQDISYGYLGAIFNTSTESKLDDSAKSEISNKQFVVNFTETEYVDQLRASGVNTEHYVKKTLVSDVTILRLKFETDGAVYNLGVVDNKQTGSDLPVNKVETKKTIGWFVWLIIAVVSLIILGPILPYVFKFLWKIVVLLFKGLWWLICWPFRIFNEKGGK